MKCPICNSSDNTKCIFQGSTPSSCIQLPQTQLEAIAAPKYTLDIHICDSCKHVFNAERVEIIYSAYPMYNSGWKKHISQQALILKNTAKCERCLDIGGGDGGFLKILSELTHKDDYAWVDPAGTCNAFTGFKEFSRHKIARYNPDTVILRHTLEHFLDPYPIMQSIIDTVQDGTVFFIEVPNVEETIERGWFCDFIPEHPHHYSRNSLCTLMYRLGLKTKTLIVGNKGTTLTFIGVKTSTEIIPPPKFSFPPVISFDFMGLQEQINEIAKKAIFWGAAGKSSMLLNHFCPLAKVFDSDQRKVGSFVPGTGHRIYGVQDIPEICNDVFITAPWRGADIYKELRPLRDFNFWTYSNNIVGRV